VEPSFSNPKIAALYQDVPREQVEALVRFRREHPVQHLPYKGHTWDYIRAGEAGEAVLLLPGALGTAESAWQHTSHLSQFFQVLVPSYPPVKTMRELAEGIAAVADQVGFSQFRLVGASYGGLVAQVFVRCYPERVERLVLSHTGHPEPERTRKNQRLLVALSLLPMGLLRRIFKKSMADFIPAGHPETAMNRAYIYEVVDFHLQRRTLVNSYRRVIDLDGHYAFSPQDLANWPGKVLIMASDNDPGIPAENRARLLALYPGAQVHMFSGTGHAASILRRDEYYQVLGDFLKA
jgi:pimeloyl-ACP methyl ester carboxylesterase